MITLNLHPWSVVFGMALMVILAVVIAFGAGMWQARRGRK